MPIKPDRNPHLSDECVGQRAGNARLGVEEESTPLGGCMATISAMQKYGRVLVRVIANIGDIG
jgi:hypothetical protein